MEVLMKFSVCLCLLLFIALDSLGAVVWTEDFSDVSDWMVIFNGQGGDASITSGGSIADLYVQSANNEVAYGPRTDGSAPLIAFDPDRPQIYTMRFIVDSVTYSTSYDIRLDQFDENTNYVGTVGPVFPQGTFVGTAQTNLGSYSFAANTRYVLPKITVFTGDGGQTVTFDHMEFDQLAVPEASTIGLMLFGLVGITNLRKRTTCFDAQCRL
jgi:hypothetical protein